MGTSLPIAQFRAKIVAVLLGMTIVPAVLVLLVGSEVIRNSADRWFNAPMNDILSSAGVSADIRVKDLSEEDVRKISHVIEEQGRVEGDLRKEISMNIKRLVEIGSYRGSRHRRNLPVRGQRTRTNSRTRKGPRKGTITLKKKETV